jgi:hypothetical protein
MSRCIWALLLCLGAIAPAIHVRAEEVPANLADEDVTITEGEERTVYEYRQNGQLRMVRIVPRFGRPYFLVPADPTRGQGDLEQRGQLVPSWRILEF